MEWGNGWYAVYGGISAAEEVAYDKDDPGEANVDGEGGSGTCKGKKAGGLGSSS